MDRFIVLIGLRASGKSTAARALARSLRCRAIDLDRRSLALLGHTSTHAAWKIKGQRAFRRAETQALKNAFAGKPCVLALGGGTPTAPGASELLRRTAKRNATIVYLRLRPKALQERLRAHTGDRPALTGTNALDEVPEIFAARDGLYRSLAQHTLNCDNDTPDRTASRVLALFRQNQLQDERRPPARSGKTRRSTQDPSPRAKLPRRSKRQPRRA